MKRWLSVLLSVGFTVGAAMVPVAVKDENVQKAILVLIGASAAAVAKKTSESNPDGTTAKVAWEKENK